MSQESGSAIFPDNSGCCHRLKAGILCSHVMSSVRGIDQIISQKEFEGCVTRSQMKRKSAEQAFVNVPPLTILPGKDEECGGRALPSYPLHFFPLPSPLPKSWKHTECHILKLPPAIEN